MIGRRAAVACLVLACAGCAEPRGQAAAPTHPTGAATPPPSTTIASTTTASTAAASTTTTTTSAATSVPVEFASEVREIGGALAARMSASWHPGCPVPLEQLREVRVGYVGADGEAHEGELVVHQAVADDVVAVFRALFDARFPIAQMHPVDAFGGDDLASVRANNTSAFNCRAVYGSTGGSWSRHAFGTAIDLNPLQNPYVLHREVVPAEAIRWVDRSLGEPGMIAPDSIAVRAFAAIGWRWGGEWTNPDYQHFDLDPATIARR